MIKLTDVVIDCPDPMALAGFYAALIGGEIAGDSDESWANVQSGGINLAFQRVENFQPPRWPGQELPQQFHLDFEVDDYQSEGDRAVALGAVHQGTEIGESGYGFVVYLDPAGHPFCLCRNNPDR